MAPLKRDTKNSCENRFIIELVLRYLQGKISVKLAV
jgi:hypothetical protein